VTQATVEESWMDPEDMKNITEGEDSDEGGGGGGGGGTDGDVGMREV
jgi:hypothetical protein